MDSIRTKESTWKPVSSILSNLPVGTRIRTMCWQFLYGNGTVIIYGSSSSSIMCVLCDFSFGLVNHVIHNLQTRFPFPAKGLKDFFFSLRYVEPYSHIYCVQFDPEFLLSNSSHLFSLNISIIYCTIKHFFIHNSIVGEIVIWTLNIIF